MVQSLHLKVFADIIDLIKQHPARKLLIKMLVSSTCLIHPFNKQNKLCTRICTIIPNTSIKVHTLHNWIWFSKLRRDNLKASKTLINNESTEHQNGQAQEQFLPSGNPSHEHLTINVEHTTLLYIYLFNTHTCLYFKFAPNIPVHTKLSILYIVFLPFCTLSILYIILFIICVLLLSFCHTVELLSLKQIPRMCKHTCNKAHSDSDSDLITRATLNFAAVSLFSHLADAFVQSDLQMRAI